MVLRQGWIIERKPVEDAGAVQSAAAAAESTFEASWQTGQMRPAGAQETMGGRKWVSAGATTARTARTGRTSADASEFRSSDALKASGTLPH
jgi:hypothetical protein